MNFSNIVDVITTKNVYLAIPFACGTPSISCWLDVAEKTGNEHIPHQGQVGCSAAIMPAQDNNRQTAGKHQDKNASINYAICKNTSERSGLLKFFNTCSGSFGKATIHYVAPPCKCGLLQRQIKKKNWTRAKKSCVGASSRKIKFHIHHILLNAQQHVSLRYLRAKTCNILIYTAIKEEGGMWVFKKTIKSSFLLL